MTSFRLGVRQTAAQNVTGTIVMMDDDTADVASMKRSETGIILHPQPHDNPNDPLNWPTVRKDLCFLIIGFQTFIGGGQTPILAAGFSALEAEFHKPLAVVSYLVGAFMLALGMGSVFASPSAVLYGKRLVYLVGILVFLVGLVVAAASKNFGTLMAGRILTGFGASPTESLALASLSELYFQHERAYRTGLYTLLLLGGKNIVPLLSLLMLQHLNRHWLYWILAMFLGLNLVLTYLFVPETFWDRSPTPSKRSLKETEAARHAAAYVPPDARPHAYALPSSSHIATLDVESLTSSHLDTQDVTHLTDGDVTQATDGDVTQVTQDGAAQAVPVGITAPPADDAASLEAKSFKNRLRVYSGCHSPDKWWMVALRPFYLYLYPPVLYGALVYSMAVVWLIVISETVLDIFKGAAYGYSQQTVGLFYLGPFIGGVLGSLSCGIVGDRLTRYMVRRNHGVYEPEFRLVMLVPATLMMCLGLIAYGWSAADADPWVAPVVFFGCLSFGSSMASTTAITYTVDCYKMFAAEALVSFNFAKNFLGFVFSLFNTSVYEKRGGKDAFVIYGCVQAFLSLVGIAVYIYGKVFREWTDRKELLRALYVPHSPSHPDNHPSKASLNGTSLNGASEDDTANTLHELK